MLHLPRPPEIRAMLHKLARHYREGGINDIAQRLSGQGYVPPWLFELEGVDVLELVSINERATRRKPRGYVFRDATRDDLPDIVTLTHPSDPATYQRLLERFLDEGHHAYVVTKDERIVGYSVVFQGFYEITVDDYGPRTLRLELDDDMRFLGNGVIDPAQRMKGLFPHLVMFSTKDAPRGTRFFSSVNQTNDVSRHSHVRLGFRPRASLVNFQFGRSGNIWRVSSDGQRETRYVFREPHTLPLKSLLTH